MRMEGVQDFLKLCSCSFWWAYRLVSRHRPIMGLYDKRPAVNTDAFVAPNASVIGDVKMAAGSSVWYNAVVRGLYSFRRCSLHR